MGRTGNGKRREKKLEREEQGKSMKIKNGKMKTWTKRKTRKRENARKQIKPTEEKLEN